jgi:hypothetical protein
VGNRVIYGNTHSSNGWPMVDEGSCTWVDIPGTNPTVRIQIQNGQPLQILRAFVADINAYVEHVRDADTACWTAGNAVSTSNHLSGTAVDIDWELHPFRVPDAGWSRDQLGEIRRIQEFYEGTVFHGNDWTDPKDSMHFQLASLANGGDIDTFNNPHTQDFINRKIRPDGFSTYRRGGQAGPPSGPTVMTVPLTPLPNGRWTSPSPAWAHLINRESGGNPTIIQQIIDVNSGGNEAEGLFQITPRTWRAHNGTEFAPCARSASPQQQAIVAARIFTRNPSGSDWGAGLPGREDAHQLAAGLVPITVQGEDDDMFTDDDRAALRFVREELSKKFGSRSPLRGLDEGLVDTLAGMDLYTNGDSHWQAVRAAAKLGHPGSLARLQEIATADPSRYPDRQEDAKLAQAILADLATAQPTPEARTVAAPGNTRELADAYAETARLREENARLREENAQLKAAPASVAIENFNSAQTSSGTTGQTVAQLVDSVEAWTEKALAMDTKQKAALNSSLEVLKLPKGSDK